LLLNFAPNEFCASTQPWQEYLPLPRSVVPCRGSCQSPPNTEPKSAVDGAFSDFLTKSCAIIKAISTSGCGAAGGVEALGGEVEPLFCVEEGLRTPTKTINPITQKITAKQPPAHDDPVALTGAPQCGHTFALVLTSWRHSPHFISATFRFLPFSAQQSAKDFNCTKPYALTASVADSFAFWRSTV
jgi:hypothetical protein